MKPYRIQLRTMLCLTMVMLGSGLAQGQTSSFNQRQPDHQWKSKHGNFEFNGKALKKEGNYIVFRTKDRFEITLPVKYLSEQDLTYLKYLEGSGPLPAGMADTSSEPSPGPTSTPPPFGGMTTTPQPSSSDTAANGDTTAPAPSDSKPAEPQMGDPTQSYPPGAAVEALVDGQWHPGKVFVVRSSDNHYYVSVTINGRAHSSWISATELRPQSATPTVTSPMSGSDTPKPMESSDFKEVKVTSKKDVGYDVGPMRQGDTLKLRHISGKWKSWGNQATESPDADSPAGGDKCRMAICEVRPINAVHTITLVPGGTATTPYTWQADRDYEQIILQINDPDKTFPDNPDRDVTYALAIERSGS